MNVQSELASFKADAKVKERKVVQQVAPNTDSGLPSKEMMSLKQHYESELDIARKERQDMIIRCQELTQNFERLKIESVRQISYFKNKYSEYKVKLRKANSNIATLTARIAKYDIELAAEREDQAEQHVSNAPNLGYGD